MSLTIHSTDDLAAYVLGALERAEEAAVGTHLETCDSCRDEVRSLAEGAWTIAGTAGRDTPSGLRAAIVTRARADDATLPRGLGGIFEVFKRPVPLGVPVALAAILVVALLGYGSARRDADRYAEAIAGVAGARVVALAATDPSTGIRGSLVMPSNGASAYLILDLPAPPAGRTWEAWVIHGATPRRAGITAARGITTLVVDAPLAAGDVVAITAEPSGGVESPTGTPVLAGTS